MPSRPPPSPTTRWSTSSWWTSFSRRSRIFIPRALTIAWAKGRPGQATMQYEIMGSAYGGGMGHDGACATATHLSNLHITPIEILESEFPCRITRFELLPDSGGAGQWRGGSSLVREYELLEDATVIRRFDKAKFPPRGLAGGKNGA